MGTSGSSASPAPWFAAPILLANLVEVSRLSQETLGSMVEISMAWLISNLVQVWGLEWKYIETI